MTTYKLLTGLADEMIASDMPVSTVDGPIKNLNAWLLGALQQEPDDAETATNRSLRGPVTRWLGYAFGNPRITRSQATALLPLEPGDPNPFFIVVDAVSRESRNDDVGSSVVLGESSFALASVSPVTRDIWRTPEYATALVLTGGDALDLPVWFVVDDPRAVCPLADVGNPETWETWGTHAGSHLPIQLGGKWYRSSNVGAEGRLLNASEWVTAMLGGAVRVISHHKFREIQAANQPTPNV